MQVLVKLTAHLPETLSEGELGALFAAERERALELMAEGKIAQMWRIMGTSAGISLWDVESPEELHASLSSLPAWKFCDVDITPVIQHPLELAFQNEATR